MYAFRMHPTPYYYYYYYYYYYLYCLLSYLFPFIAYSRLPLLYYSILAI